MSNDVRDWTPLRVAAETREVRPADSRCDCSSLGFHFDLRTVVHPDGAIVTCLRCRREWVEFRVWPKPGDIITAK